MKLFNKKNFIVITVILIFCMAISTYFYFNIEIKSNNKNISTGQKEKYGTYQKASNIVKEVMRDYYIKGSRIQYNHSRAFWGIESPEDATSQNILYQVCSAYSSNIYKEAFGINNNNGKFPRSSDEIITAARDYYVCKDSDITKRFECSKRNGTYLIYYQNTQNVNYSYTNNSGKKNTATLEKSKYIYKNAENFSQFVDLIKPGDIFAYTGHVLVAYDVLTNPSTGKKDVLILHSTRSAIIRSRIGGTSALSYDVLPSAKGLNKKIDIDGEGTIQYTWLSNLTDYFVKDNKIECGKKECIVMRPFYNDNGTAVFNYPVDKQYYKKSELRVEYPGLDIDKTVNKYDGNNVYLNDTLEYTITVSNKSSTTYNGKNYSRFYIEEILDDKVDFVSSTQNGKISGKKITWTINSLSAGKSISLKYKVKVKNILNNLNKTILSKGRFYKDSTVDISLANINNKIVMNDATNLSKVVSECFQKNKSKYSGLTLINEVYKCSTKINFEFNKFTFESLLNKKVLAKVDVSDVITLKKDVTSSNQKFINMILNNYWGGTAHALKNNATILSLPRWTGNSASRAETIDSRVLKDGDILIYYINNDCNSIPGFEKKTIKNKTTCDSVYAGKYTTEKGLYAYIYINGTFVGVNGSGTTSRNDFTYKYYNKYDKTGNVVDNSLYTRYSRLTGIWKPGTEKFENTMSFSNYQTLFEKDYYVILRPSLIMKYNILFSSNGGTGTMSNQTMTYGTSSKIIKNTFKRTGYTFAGWNTKSNGSGKAYKDEQSVSNLITDGGVVNLYAQWKANKYTIRYNANGGTGTMNSQTMTYGISTKIIKNIFKRTGYTFAGWNTKSDGSGKTYKDEQSVSNLTTIDSGVVNLYAQWIANQYFQISKYIENGKYIKNISSNITLKEYLSNFKMSSNYTVEVYNKNGKELLKVSEKIGTGSILKVYNSKKLEKQLINIVIGDINGDGKVNSTDIGYVSNCIIGTKGYKLSDVDKSAFDITKDGKVNSTDVGFIANHIIGTKGYENLIK